MSKDSVQGLFIMVVTDTSPISITPLPPAATFQCPMATFQCQAPKRNLPIEQEPCEDAKRPGRHLKLASAVTPFDSEEIYLLILDNPCDPSPFRRNGAVCAGFSCQGQECSLPKGGCNLKHIFKASPSSVALIKEV